MMASRRGRQPPVLVVVRIEHVDDDGQVHLVAVPTDDPAAIELLDGRRGPHVGAGSRCTNDVPRQR